ncbi:hypothetical protein [Streptomyces sp. BH105]|uniref:hypothetical protein n=1 Tax=Streptomyces sp. BH105 TaxID=3410408 RepID=UPI003CF77DAC
MGFVKTAFEQGDRVLIDWFGAKRPGTFVEYDSDPRTAFPDDHLTHPGCRIAYFEMDDMGCVESGWELHLSPLSGDPREQQVARLQSQIKTKRDEIICLEREIGTREDRLAQLRGDIKERPFQPEAVQV